RSRCRRDARLPLPPCSTPPRSKDAHDTATRAAARSPGRTRRSGAAVQTGSGRTPATAPRSGCRCATAGLHAGGGGQAQRRAGAASIAVAQRRAAAVQFGDLGDETEPDATAAVAPVGPRQREETLEHAILRVIGYSRTTVGDLDRDLVAIGARS